MFRKLIDHPDKSETLVVCCFCLKVKVDHNSWEYIHEDFPDILNFHFFKKDKEQHRFIFDHLHNQYYSEYDISHGYCPTCAELQIKELRL